MGYGRQEAVGILQGQGMGGGRDRPEEIWCRVRPSEVGSWSLLVTLVEWARRLGLARRQTQPWSR